MTLKSNSQFKQAFIFAFIIAHKLDLQSYSTRYHNFELLANRIATTYLISKSSKFHKITLISDFKKFY